MTTQLNLPPIKPVVYELIARRTLLQEQLNNAKDASEEIIYSREIEKCNTLLSNVEE